MTQWCPFNLMKHLNMRLYLNFYRTPPERPETLQMRNVQFAVQMTIRHFATTSAALTLPALPEAPTCTLQTQDMYQALHTSLDVT